MASLGLVADYGTESDSDSSENNDKTSNVNQNEAESKISQQAGLNLLSGDGINSEESGQSEDEVTEKESTTSLENPFGQKKKLPNPLADNRMGTKGLVFLNEYQQAEASKDSILEQHVKMTEAPSLMQKTIGGKKVCWNYRKMGRCNKGHKCQFAHDNDITLQSGKLDTDQSTSGATSSRTGSAKYSYHGGAPQADPEDDDSYMGQAKKRHRVGVANALVPPKRAMTSLDKFRAKERPWTQGPT